MKLEWAIEIANDLREQMAPYCQRIEIAGSIRRRKNEVKDIEIVAVPEWQETPDLSDLFGESTIPVNRLHQWATSTNCAVKWIKPGTPNIIPWKVEPDGRYWRGLLSEGIKLDLFLAQPENWGVIYLIRTGSAEFSYAVATYAKKRGCAFANGSLTLNGQPVETPEEGDVFSQLGLDFVLPEERLGWSSVRPTQAKTPSRKHLDSRDDRFIWREGDIEIIR